MNCRAIRSPFVVLLVLGLVACASGPQPRTESEAEPNRSPGIGSVHLFRGFLSVFSLGMNDFAQEMRSHGLNASAYRYTAWRKVADRIIRGDADAANTPLVLIGHSLGADAVISLAKVLEAEGIRVAYLVTFDPFKPSPVPANVDRAVNIYQPGNGWSARLEPGLGFAGILENVDIRQRTDLGPTVSHFNIDEIDTIQAEIIEEIKKLAEHSRSPSEI